MHPLVRQTVLKAAAAGAVDVAADFDDLAELERLARAQTDPPLEDELAWLDLPVVCGDARLYRLSWGAADWLRLCALPWFGRDGRLLDRAIAWAHAHARQPAAFRLAAEPRAARGEIARWARSLAAPFEAVLAGVAALTASSRSRRGAQSGGQAAGGAGPVLGLLVAEYGRDLDYWIWGVPADVVEAMLAQHVWKQEQLAKAFARGDRAIVATDPESASARAAIAFQRAAAAFVRKVAARSAAGEGVDGAHAAPELVSDGERVQEGGKV